MSKLKIITTNLCILCFLFLEAQGDGYSSKSYSEHQYTPHTVNPPANYSELASIDQIYAPCGPYVSDIRELTIKDIQYLYSEKKLSSALLTACYLKRIKYMNPFLNAVIETNPSAVKDALRSDYERYLGYGFNRGDLHGIPILIKDNIATRDYMQTCSGSLALVGYKPLFESTVAIRCRIMGAIILGKTNLSEFANFRGTNIPNGWSGRGNQTHNCYFLHVDPWGSSTGSAVAVASNLCAVALGTETDGSIVAPSDSACSVGLKTSVGCVPTEGVIPISFSQDTVGPITRTVEDAAIFYKAIANSRCASDNTVYGEEVINDNFLMEHYTSKTFRIGIIRNPFLIANASDPDQVRSLDIVNQALSNCEGTYLQFVDPIILPSGVFSQEFLQIAKDKEFKVLLHEFKSGLNDYLKNTRLEYYDNNYEYQPYDNYTNVKTQTPGLLPYDSQRPPTLEDVIKFNNRHPVPEGYNQEILKMSQNLDGIENQTYIEARNSNIKNIRETLNSLFEENNLDALVSSGVSAFLGKSPLYTYFAIAGYPYIIVPALCTSDFKPLGLIFHGLLYSDKKLLEIAKLFESCADARQPPSFLP